MRTCNLIRNQLSTLSEYVQQRWGALGLPLFSAWALVLAFVSVARMLLLSQAVELSGNPVGSPGQIWLVFGLNAIFAVGFITSAYGLWIRQNWGRVLFLYAIIGWAAFIIIALFITNASALTPTVFYDGLRAAVGLTISLWYFNLPRIKHLFEQ